MPNERRKAATAAPDGKPDGENLTMGQEKAIKDRWKALNDKRHGVDEKGERWHDILCFTCPLINMASRGDDASRRCRAKLARADVPGKDAQAWPLIMKFMRETSADGETMLPYAVVAASIGRSGRNPDGRLNLGGMIHEACKDSADEGLSRLEAIMRCQSMESLCRMLPPLLRFIEGSSGSESWKRISHAILLHDLLRIRDGARDDVHRAWMQEFALGWGRISARQRRDARRIAELDGSFAMAASEDAAQADDKGIDYECWNH